MRLCSAFIAVLSLSSCASGPTLQQQEIARDRAKLAELNAIMEHIWTLCDENGRLKRPLTEEENRKLQEVRFGSLAILQRSEARQRTRDIQAAYRSHSDAPLLPKWTPPEPIHSSSGSSFGGFKSNDLTVTSAGYGNLNISDRYGNTVHADKRAGNSGTYDLKDKYGNTGTLTPTSGGNFEFRDQYGKTSRVTRESSGTYRAKF